MDSDKKLLNELMDNYQVISTEHLPVNFRTATPDEKEKIIGSYIQFLIEDSRGSICPHGESEDDKIETYIWVSKAQILVDEKTPSERTILIIFLDNSTLKNAPNNINYVQFLGKSDSSYSFYKPTEFLT